MRHTSKFINPILRRLLPLLEPTRNDKTLPKFSNYADLWGATAGGLLKGGILLGDLDWRSR